jgi:energy-coupling factor transport system ATP-binding protein
MKELLEVTNLSYKDLFENISFQVEPEKFITISGANNCGKTTLIRILSGQIPTTQEIKLLGMYIEEYPQNLWKEITGTIIPQDNPTFLFKTVEEELNYTIHLFKKAEEEKKETYKEIIKKYKLTKYQKKNPNEVPEFIKIKILLAEKLLGSPQILFLDDICGELDIKEKKEMINLLRTLQLETGISIIMTTSDLNIALESDYLLIIDEKKLLLEGEPLSIIEKDNVLNKIGLELPFMVDLSVKLRDYNLVEKTELDIDRLVDNIWK